MDQRYVTEEKKKCADSVLTVSGSLILNCLTKLPVVDARVWGSQRVSAYTYLWPDSPQMEHADPLSENHEDQFAGSQETARSRTSSPSPVNPRSHIGQHLCICHRRSLELLFGEATAEGCSTCAQSIASQYPAAGTPNITFGIVSARWPKEWAYCKQRPARRKVRRSSWPSAHARPILRALQPSVRRAGLQPTVVWGRTALRSDAAIGRVRHA